MKNAKLQKAILRIISLLHSNFHPRESQSILSNMQTGVTYPQLKYYPLWTSAHLIHACSLVQWIQCMGLADVVINSDLFVKWHLRYQDDRHLRHTPDSWRDGHRLQIDKIKNSNGNQRGKVIGGNYGYQEKLLTFHVYNFYFANTKSRIKLVGTILFWSRNPRYNLSVDLSGLSVSHSSP